MAASLALRIVVTFLLTSSMLAGLGTTARADQSTATEPTDQDEETPNIRVTIYPILVKAPIFGASVDLPSVASAPGAGDAGEAGAASGSTDLSLNTAYMAGALVEANRWFGEFSGLYAALSASRSTPRVTIDSKTYFFTARGGVRLLGGFSATAGVRRLTVDLDAALTVPILEKTLEGKTKPGLWDPLVGIDWRRSPGRWSFDANVQGGSFGVGADEDLSAEVHARWRPVRHVELRGGYSIVHIKLTVADVSVGSFQRTLIARQTLHGPELGIGIVF
jgi:hypothetical protein